MSNLDQAEADALLAMNKERVNDASYDFPTTGASLAIDLKSSDGTEAFVLDIQRKGRIKLSKVTYQSRARKGIILARLDIDGPPHRNPDQSEVPCPHLHVYREGYDDRWAEPVPPQTFTDLASMYQTCLDFMIFCNITLPPQINPALV
uniref:Uncharacterized protein n=1 Tax=mine drainage metagenome TaxID=410659 RepID=E6PG83_9ZZZZ